MTVTAYASGNAAPKVNPDVDVEIDLSAVVLPQPAQLYGDGADSTDPIATFTFQWYILSESVPTTPAAFLGASTLQNASIQANVWGNVRMFLVATNSVTLVSSETDPLQAPDSAFCRVRVLSANTGLQKTAPGERNYQETNYDLVEAVDTGAGTPVAHAILSHTDVAVATGPDLDAMAGGGYAENPPATSLHRHKGADVDVATTVTQGTVTLEDAGGSGSVIQKERVQFSGAFPGALLSTGFWPGVVVPKGYDGDAGGNFSNVMLAWRAKDAITIEEWSVSLLDGGPAVPTTKTNIRLYTGTAAQFEGNALVVAGAAQNLVPALDNGPAFAKSAALAISVAAGDYLALVCESAPKQSEGDNPGVGLTATVHGYRLV
jgi:hypothetical protein